MPEPQFERPGLVVRDRLLEGETRHSVEMTHEFMLMARFNPFALIPEGSRFVDVEWCGKTGSIKFYYETPEETRR